MGSEPFRAILRTALRPLAVAAEHTGCFFKGLRLVGIDGTQWSLSNTPQINTATTKTRTRRGLAAFAKMSLVAMVELGSHAPLAAAYAAGALRELAWSVALLAQLPPGSLLILDRLYGQAPMLDELQSGCAQTDSHFLVRVRRKLAVHPFFARSALLLNGIGFTTILKDRELTPGVANGDRADQSPGNSSHPSGQHVGWVVNTQIDAADTDKKRQEHGPHQTVELCGPPLNDLHEKGAEC